MKYSKIVKVNLESKIIYFGVFIFSAILFLILCSGYINLYSLGTWFTGNTAVLDSPYDVTYYPNYPTNVDLPDSIQIYDANLFYEVLDNSFVVPDEYIFINWNTNSDGSGKSYNMNDIIAMSENVILYAQWEFIGIVDDLPDNDIDDKVDGDDSIDLPSDSDESDDNNSDETNDNSGNTSVGGNGNTSGTPGNGSSGGGSSSSNGNSANNSSTGSGNSSNIINGSNNNNNINSKPKKKYIFKYLYDDEEIAVTSCVVSDNDMCELVLPTNIPNVNGYNFVGWSTSFECDINIISKPILVDSDKIYYACYKEDSVNNVDDDKKANDYVYVIVSIWIISSILIYFVIKKFKKSNVNIVNN